MEWEKGLFTFLAVSYVNYLLFVKYFDLTKQS